MTEEQIWGVKEGLSRQKLFIALGCIEHLEKENKQLKAQIEKMKCCNNCKHFKEYDEYTDNVYYACVLEKCDNLDNWELAE